MGEVQTHKVTVIAAGHGPDVPTALGGLLNEINKLTKDCEWEMKHFTVYQEMKLRPMNPGQAEITHYAIAVIETKFLNPVIMDPEQ